MLLELNAPGRPLENPLTPRDLTGVARYLAVGVVAGTVSKNDAARELAHWADGDRDRLLKGAQLIRDSHTVASDLMLARSSSRAWPRVSTDGAKDGCAPNRRRTNPRRRSMEVKELGHLVLYVRDVERSARFYRDVLGWRQILPDDRTGMPMPVAAVLRAERPHPPRAAADRGGPQTRRPSRRVGGSGSTTSA